MFRRFFIVASTCVAALALSIPAFASSHVVHQWNSPAHVGTILFHVPLSGGHVYHIQVSSSAHVKFTAQGAELITYVVNGRAGTLNKAVNFNGTTPFTFTLKQPAKVSALEWIFGMQLLSRGRQSFSARLIDTGRHA